MSPRALVVLAFPLLWGHAWSGEMPDEVLAKVKSSAVLVTSQRRSREFQGSGYLLGKRCVVTHPSALGMVGEDLYPPKGVTVRFHSGEKGEKTLGASLVGVDADQGCAYLELAEAAPPSAAELSAETPLAEIAETMPVFVLGYPFGSKPPVEGGAVSVTVHSGSVSRIQKDGGHVTVLQLNEQVPGAMLGGPVVDSRGRLVGTAVENLRATGISFALPTELLRLNLQGRLTGLRLDSLARGATSEDTYSARVSVGWLSGSAQPQAVWVEWWTGSESTQPRKLDPVTQWPCHGSVGDTAIQKVELTWDPSRRCWTGALAQVLLPSKRQLFLQASARLADGKTVSVRPSFYSQDETRNAQVCAKPLQTGTVLLPPGDEPLAPSLGGITLVLDADQPYLRLLAPVALYRDHPPYLDLVAHPTGKELYAIQGGKPCVQVLDPLTLAVREEIVCPRYPDKLWCDGQYLAVVCRESRVISFLDIQKRDYEQTFRVPVKELVPLAFCGRSPFGNWATLWEDPERTTNTFALYLWRPRATQPAAPAELKGGGQVAPFRDFCFGDSENTAYVNPGGIWRREFPGIQPPAQKANPSEAEFKIRQRLGGAYHARVQEGRRLLVGDYPWSNDRAVSYHSALCSFDGRQVFAEMRGWLCAEYPEQDVFVMRSAVTRHPPTNIINRTPEEAWVTFCRRANGQVTRIVLPLDPPEHKNYESDEHDVNVVFVPRHEIVYVQVRHASDTSEQRRARPGLMWGLAAFRCGPVDLKRAADMLKHPRPPNLARVGSAVEYRPFFQSSAMARSVVFMLRDPKEGMQIDPKSGKFSWQPNEKQKGKHTIEIMVRVDGEVYPVIKWEVMVP